MVSHEYRDHASGAEEPTPGPNSRCARDRGDMADRKSADLAVSARVAIPEKRATGRARSDRDIRELLLNSIRAPYGRTL